MHKKLLITDLDNTLYDWVTFYTYAFKSMVAVLSRLISIGEDQLLLEFKAVHQRYGNSEQPYAALELPSVRRYFETSDYKLLKHHLDPAFHAFNKARKTYLMPYSGVISALSCLRGNGVTIVGHTEAIALNAFWRLNKIGAADYFSRLYTLEGLVVPHTNATSEDFVSTRDFIRELPKSERKPNPILLVDICRREGFEPQQAVYIGDSLVRDISMAKAAGVTAAWAKYGLEYDRSLWEYLVKITHWTDADVAREESLRTRFSDVHPDVSLNSFGEILELFSEVDTDPRSGPIRKPIGR